MFALGLVALVVSPASALADPTTAQYRSSLSQISAGSAGGSDPGTASTEAASGLPFTGLDVGLLAAVAAGLLIAGFVLARQASSES